MLTGTLQPINTFKKEHFVHFLKSLWGKFHFILTTAEVQWKHESMSQQLSMTEKQEEKSTFQNIKNQLIQVDDMGVVWFL